MSTAPQLTPSSPPAAQPVCPDHTDRVSLGTCARCGRFMCSTCRSDDGTCPSCVRQAQRSAPATGTRAKVAVAFLGVSVGSEAFNMLAAIAPVEALGDRLIAAIEGFSGLGLLVGLVGGAISFLMWLHGTVRQASAFGHDIGMTPGWAVGWWFVPFANLVKPYHAVRNVVGAFGGEPLVARLSLGLWWAAWLIGNVLGNIETRMALSDGLNATPSSAVQVVGLASSIFGILGALLCIRIVRETQKVIDRKRAA